MKPVFACLLLLSLASTSKATLAVPNIFSDHAVLQRSSHTEIWGSGTPGETVQLSLGSGPMRQTVSDARGKWHVSLDLSQSSLGPFELVVKSKGDTLTMHDVVVGDVWICSGQSNMEFKLSQTSGGAAEIAKSADPLLRCFMPRRQAVATPAESLDGRWVIADPSTSANFSGVAYYFAKKVEESQHTPLGLVDTSWGGTPIESWISSEGFDLDPQLKLRKDAILAESPREEHRAKQFWEDFANWVTQYHREDVHTSDAAFADPAVSTADWKTVTLPGKLTEGRLPDTGVVWLRREVKIPPSRANTYLPLLLGTPHDFETVYWNGEKVGETTAAISTSINPGLSSTMNRRYDVPGDRVKAGENTLAIRLYSPAGNAGLHAEHFFAGWDIPLSGEWKAKVEREFPPLPTGAATSYPSHPSWPAMPHYTATYVFNGMVHPLEQLTLKGVIWYQGEANVDRAHQYRTTFSRLIKDWREHFAQHELPFYFCQLANFQAKRAIPMESAWAELREAQAQTLTLPQTGMAVLIDLGEEDDIHFRNKKDVGERLADVALAKTYGEKIPYAGPFYQSSEAQDNLIRLHFTNVDGGLVAKMLPITYQPKSSFPATKSLLLPSPQSELQGFAVCGEDRQWKWAKARIDGETVIVWSPEVAVPKFVRYAWSDNPTCNLYNKPGFPAVPFRTDTFADLTAKALF